MDGWVHHDKILLGQKSHTHRKATNSSDIIVYTILIVAISKRSVSQRVEILQIVRDWECTNNIRFKLILLRINLYNLIRICMSVEASLQ